MRICSIEESLGIMAGLAPCTVNIRLDSADKSLICSLAKQVSNNVGLTDKQLSVALLKIDKYRAGLTLNNIDVDNTLQFKQLTIPLRVVNRDKKLAFVDHFDTKAIAVYFTYSNDFLAAWEVILTKITGPVHEMGYCKIVKLTEDNIFQLVSILAPLEFSLSTDIQTLYDEIAYIYANKSSFVPIVDIQNNHVQITNLNENCKQAIDAEFPTVSNILHYVTRLKHYGITNFSNAITDKIDQTFSHTYSKIIATVNNTRFRIRPKTTPIFELTTITQDLNQWPVLILVDENREVMSHVKSIIDAYSRVCSNEEMTVFFRLDNHNDKLEFSEYVKNNNLNNYIDTSTKVVIISRSRIPKALFKANWTPKLAIVCSNHDFGKTSVYLNEVPMVFYYNDSITVKYDKIKGNLPIVDLQTYNQG
jgi:hypothetical protein